MSGRPKRTAAPPQRYVPDPIDVVDADDGDDCDDTSSSEGEEEKATQSDIDFVVSDSEDVEADVLSSSTEEDAESSSEEDD